MAHASRPHEIEPRQPRFGRFIVRAACALDDAPRWFVPNTPTFTNEPSVWFQNAYTEAHRLCPKLGRFIAHASPAALRTNLPRVSKKM